MNRYLELILNVPTFTNVALNVQNIYKFHSKNYEILRVKKCNLFLNNLWNAYIPDRNF